MGLCWGWRVRTHGVKFLDMSPLSRFIHSTFTFWRFMIEIPLGPNEMRVSYTVNHGQELTFCVPGRNQNMRLAAYSVST